MEFCFEWISDIDLEEEEYQIQQQKKKDEAEQRRSEPLSKKQKLELLDDFLLNNLKRKMSFLILSNKK